MELLNQQFIPHAEALQLKKLGFNEPCFTRWNNFWAKPHEWYADSIIATTYINHTQEDLNKRVGLDNPRHPPFIGYQNHVVHNIYGEVLAAPTWDQAFNWFLKTHEIMISIKPVYANPEFWNCDFTIDIFDKGGNVGIIRVKGDYRKAMIVGLESLIRMVEMQINFEK